MSPEIQQYDPFVLVLFGATGDLSKRKLFPALYSLYQNNQLHNDFAVIGVGRSELSREKFLAELKESISTYARIPMCSEEEWQAFISHFDYTAVNVKDATAYGTLTSKVQEYEAKFNLPGNRMFYLALAPELFGVVSNNLKDSGLTDAKGWKRLIIEKPFGHDLESAKTLNEEISRSFNEEEVYRIDHYLGKEMVQNIEVIRFANSMFEPLWNNRYIDNIQITASETVGVEERAAYYEHSGALRDMVQNHMLQMVMMVCMEPPSRLKTEAVRDEKVKVLRALRRYAEQEVAFNVVRGQYSSGEINGEELPGYRSEHGVAPKSSTETFVAAKLFVDNFRWAGVPIYIRTGKRMPKKTTEIIIQFKELPKNLYFNKNNDLGPNLLIIRINPEEGMYLLLNAKRQGTDDKVVPIAMEFCNNCSDQSPEAYESLLYDAATGDSTFFTRWDEVSIAWKFVDPIRRAWDQTKEEIPHYPSGTWGPDEAHQLLARDGKKWWPVFGERESEVVVKAKEQPAIL
ncbi:glucose-6-phosphate dehydrogenase [Aneurinibacillus sp. Ricciae_BoGa-3]|uniref:glucose-6-phosphate dehydrogenase n=1 Tax=Aneurinibacillus sp. Ricciae_BoGa-3 TaxID=3022697 RepID=UPI00233FF58C|nr:glucose-6-phosphate dehydrogenase [Aneurinibacillus sp. Ricciae_BoGa-3]WCK52723.1 glucose-6-phosphate dehydrogenase [Aneurinibacillus sp. Ricciae_BoGa-3]